jgi:hypothetical protein
MTRPDAGRAVNPGSSVCVFPKDTRNAGKMVNVMRLSQRLAEYR